MDVLTVDGVCTSRCDDCPRQRVTVAEAMHPTVVRVTVLAGCAGCEGSHMTIAR